MRCKRIRGPRFQNQSASSGAILLTSLFTVCVLMTTLQCSCLQFFVLAAAICSFVRAPVISQRLLLFVFSRQFLSLHPPKLFEIVQGLLQRQAGRVQVALLRITCGMASYWSTQKRTEATRHRTRRTRSLQTAKKLASFQNRCSCVS